ncbi:MAG: DEAD/DEAH box helicase [Planctomycetota bacterium]|jgi:superfamily II DNA/RNA helicase
MDRSETCDKFLDTLPFDPYEFQEEALLAWFDCTGGVLVAAPTGMGKTLIAESAIYEALATRQRLYYTTPLIALTDQKFREFQDKAEEWGFDRDDIGLITGNRKVNPDARVRIVVAEILLNHLLAGEERFDDVLGVVMDEFHYFNDYDRGIVWELSLALLPENVKLLLLSATVGNSPEFVYWMKKQHGRELQLITTDDRKVPLEFDWVEDKILAEFLPGMVTDDDGTNRSPALVFCFHRDECWEIAERLKGVKLTDQATRSEIEKHIDKDQFAEGIGPKLRQMLICGVGVHHAGVLPRYKEVVEKLFLQKLIPFVICTETLAAGVNLPARSVVITTLLKGPRGEKKIIPASAAHQMFGRAGRPQFDTRGHVVAMAHEDDVKINKWRKRYEQIDTKSKDPGIMRARKDLERKKPSRRKTEQYWTEGQFKTLIGAGPAKLESRRMIPYQFLIYLLTRTGALHDVREFLKTRFTEASRIEKFQNELNYMTDNLAVFGYLTKAEDGDHMTLADNIGELLSFRSIDPLYGAFMVKHLASGSLEEKLVALESVLPLPPAIERRIRLPELEPGPLQTGYLEPTLIQMGLITARPQVHEEPPEEQGPGSFSDYWRDDDEEREPENLPQMLKALFDAKLSAPEDVMVRAKWVAGYLFEMDGEFYKYCKAVNLTKNEGLILRHLLRLVILAGEFHALSEDPDYASIGERCTSLCQSIDQRYTERFLTADVEARKLAL